jgi:hypothetical protein
MVRDMTGYTKLFGSILRSTVWRAPAHVRLVWIALLALADRDGEVDASIPGLADAAGVELEQCEEALAVFLAPDRYSRTPDHEGRRIEKIDGGWRLLNHAKYQQRLGLEERRQRDRERQARHRAAVKSRETSAEAPLSRPVTAGHTESDTQTQLQTQTQTEPSPKREGSSRARARATGGVDEPEPRPSPVLDEARRAEAARARLAPIWRERTGATPLELSALTPRAEIVAQLAGLPDEPQLSAAVGRFFDDEAMRRKGWPVAWFLRNPAQWTGRGGAKGGHAPARKGSDYEAREMSFEQLMQESEGKANG